MGIDLTGKRVSILGAGRSGLAVAKAVKSLGGNPFVSDSAESITIESKTVLEGMNIDFELGGHSSKVLDCDLMVVSPGVSSNTEIVTEAESKGLIVWPEIELAFRLCRGKIIGVTGSNGKTTTTTLIGEMLKAAGREVAVCGNIGSPFISDAVNISENGIVVVELSSFQLEMIDEFRPNVAVFLNITPDHLDRHGSLESYISSKMRIFENQMQDDFAVVNYDDKILKDECDGLVASTTWFSVSKEIADGVWGDPSGDISAMGRPVIRSEQVAIQGLHNLSNSCAAVGAALLMEIDLKDIAEVLRTFPGVEHRLEPVRLIGGVSFINDSKGTNVDSVHWALLAVSAPVILIAGGKDKGGDFSALNDLIEEKVKKAILIGQAAEKIEKTWGNLVDCSRAESLRAAVEIAYDNATEGDTVLLSPGCASFDMFDNYEHRGRVFKEAVNELASRRVAQ